MGQLDEHLPRQHLRIGEDLAHVEHRTAGDAGSVQQLDPVRDVSAGEHALDFPGERLPVLPSSSVVDLLATPYHVHT